MQTGATRRRSMLKKTIILLIGSTVLLVGVAMILLPGPAFILIPLGIAILALEFEWAQKLLEWMKKKLRQRRENG
jgi:tellurite resistance protein TerC